MSTETTKLLWESVIVFVDVMEIVAVMLPALGLCLCAALMIREAIRMQRGARQPRSEIATGLSGAFIDTSVPIDSGELDSIGIPTFTETDPVTIAYTGGN